MCRYVSAAVLLTLFAALPACEDDPTPTEIDVEIFSSVPRLDRIHLMVRDQSIDRDRGYNWAELDVTNVADRDLTTTPALVRLTESEALKGKPFLLYATGYVADAGSTSQRLTVAGAITMQYVDNQRQVKRLRLNQDFLATDRDDDGFRACGSFTPPTDPAEQNVLDDARNCDCNDNNDLINGFNVEICGDNADNNCTGWPYDENCADCVEDQPCTNLPPEQWLLAGVGACTLGVYRCLPTTVDGQTVRRLNTTCEGAQGPSTEVVDGRDNDCDGVADELTNCLDGTPPRPCFMGFIETEATTRAKGECRAGEQRCVGGVWENQCRNEVRPQRPPRDTLEQDNALPVAWSGIGFFELAIPSRGVQQCDGRDNDCDGFYDEEPTFDFDNDGYTYCGTNDAPPAVPRQHTLPGTDPTKIDCNDNNNTIYPFADERCDDTVDNDCACDHGPLGAVSGTPGCASPDTYLDCSRTERASTPSGTCDEIAGGVFYARYGNSPTAPNRRFGCFPCRAAYGLTCSPSGVTCSSKDEGCCVAGACPSADTLTDTANGTLAGPVFRPYCAEPDPGTCTCTVGPSWHAAAAGTEPNNGGVLLDDRDDCGAIDCTPYFFGVDAADGRCYTRADIPAAEAFCLGKPLCAPSIVNPSCCSGETGQNCCETPSDRCPARDVRGPEHAVARAICTQVTAGTCVGQAAPTYQPVPVNTDPFNDCAGGLNCNGAGACLLPLGSSCTASSQCNSGLSCVDGVCCGSSACGECQACNVPGNLGTCTAVPGDSDADSCNAACNYCSGGSCLRRGADDNVECGTCQRCDGSNTACQNVTADNGKNCTSGCNFCSGGSCQTRGADQNQECGTCQRCNGSSTSCQNVTGDSGKNCTDACSSCVSGSCNVRGADDTTECGNCQRCDGSSLSCQNVTADNGKGCNETCRSCVAGACQTRGADQNQECGTCQRCDGSNTSCQSVTAAEGQGCTGSCSECVNGSCQGRSAGSFAECGGTCQGCSAPFGSCGPITGTQGSNCTNSGTFCCSGSCISPGGSAELGGSCGFGACSGVWQCSPVAGCSASGNECDTCDLDTIENRTCGGTWGETCSNVLNTFDCAACQTCQLGGGTGSCVDRPGGDDSTDPNTCEGNETCDDFGNCLLDLDQSCSSNGECVTGCCSSGSGCNGSGTCRLNNGASCSSNAECGSNCCDVSGFRPCSNGGFGATCIP